MLCTHVQNIKLVEFGKDGKPSRFIQKHNIHMSTIPLHAPGNRGKKLTNYSEWQQKTECVICLQFRPVLFYQRRTETKLWQWCVLTSPKRNLCLFVCVHPRVCVCALIIWLWITQLWGSRLTSFHPANFHCSLPQLFLNLSLPALHLSSVTGKDAEFYKNINISGIWVIRVKAFFYTLHSV